MGLPRRFPPNLGTRIVYHRNRLLRCFRFMEMLRTCFLKIGFCLQRRNGEDIPVAQTKNINHRRFAASFRLQEVTKTDQDLYRCVTQSERGSGVSNFAQLIVRGKVGCFAFTSWNCLASLEQKQPCRYFDWFLNLLLFISSH